MTTPLAADGPLAYVTLITSDDFLMETRPHDFSLFVWVVKSKTNCHFCTVLGASNPPSNGIW